ncbi:hypothetical protein M3Y98_00515200 [Aphelenchoides besseyi]|nr:hypothetical protein M3Y98_00515200 [Aphelenchoides besseyi]KAI6207891.1 hypothetical protein M3Y96_00057000 [Aphelenchoides besseyi]
MFAISLLTIEIILAASHLFWVWRWTSRSSLLRRTSFKLSVCSTAIMIVPVIVYAELAFPFVMWSFSIIFLQIRVD